MTPDDASPLRTTDAPDLQRRVAGQAVIAALLDVQSQVPPQPALLRLAGRSPLTEHSRPWYLGALGEIAVGRLLSRLGPAWHVLHAVPVGKNDTDIDHVVVGPAGVFTVNTKHHPGQSVWVAGPNVQVAGKKQQHVRKAEAEARRASELLSRALGQSVPVVPVVVVVGAGSLTIRSAPERVEVLAAESLVRHLRRRPSTLTPVQVDDVVAVASRASTWRSLPVRDEDPTALLERFAVLDAAVRRARLLRTLWPLAGAASVAVGGLTVGPDLLTGLLVRP